MQIPTWIKPAITGGIVGAIAITIFGFSQGGWMLGSSAKKMAEQASAAAVIKALVPLCVSQSKEDPVQAAKLEAITSTYDRRDSIMKAGWATMPAAEKPDRDLATACAKALSGDTSDS